MPREFVDVNRMAIYVLATAVFDKPSTSKKRTKMVINNESCTR